MLPIFPEFKRLDISDKNDIEKITLQHPPYSDFNFTSMWLWDVKEEVMISQLNNNLIVRFTDYLTGESFYSFLGHDKVNETAEILLNFIKNEGMNPQLKLVPEESISSLSKEHFCIAEDMDNFDYIYDLNQISMYEGSQFMRKRNKVRRFLKTFPNSRVEILNLQKKDTQTDIFRLDEFWFKNKAGENVDSQITNEAIAIKRFFQAHLQGHFSEVLGIGIFLDSELIGYSIFDIIPGNRHAVSHFSKANTTFVGVYDYFLRECAKILIDHGCTHLNYEQDLGIPGLRESKRSFLSKFLKKTVVSFPQNML